MMYQCLVTLLMFLAERVTSENKTLSFPFLTPPDQKVDFIMRAFVELRNQWCPSQRYKKMFILNYNTDQFSEEILTAILKLNDMPKILSNEPNGLTYWTFEIRRCAILMMRGYEKFKKGVPIYYGSRYFIFQPKLLHNTFMEDLDSGRFLLLDKAYQIVYNHTAVGIYHKNFFSNQTISLDPLDIRVPDDLRDLHGRKLRMWLVDGSPEVTSFDAYLGETIAQKRNATFELVQQVSTDTDYGVMHIGVPFLGMDNIRALGSTFITALVPRSKPKPIISVLVDPFDYYTWIALLAMICTMGLVLSQFGTNLHKLHSFEVGLELVMCILSGPSRTYRGWLEKQLITLFCLLSIVIVASYQSLIISYLSVVRYYPEINSAQQIRNHCIFPYDTAFAPQLDLETSDHLSRKTASAADGLCFLFNSRDNRRITSLLLAHSRDTNPVADAAYKQNLRIADTIFYEFHLLYYFYHKSMIREMFPYFINAFYESGLFDQYYKNKSIPSFVYKQDSFVNRGFTVGDLSIVWYLLIAGMAASTACFALEVIRHYFLAQKFWIRLRGWCRGRTNCKW